MDHIPCVNAGSLMSSDVLITLSALPDGEPSTVAVESIVIEQFGEDIVRTIRQCLERFQLSSVAVHAGDRGALKCTIEARMEAAAARYREARQ